MPPRGCSAPLVLRKPCGSHLLPRLMGVLHSSETAGSFAAVERHIEGEIKRIVEQAWADPRRPLAVGGRLRAPLLDPDAALDQGALAV